MRIHKFCPRKKRLSDGWRAWRTVREPSDFFIDNQSRYTVQLFFLDQRFEVRFRGKILINERFTLSNLHLANIIS